MRRIGHNFRDVIEADPEIVRLTKRGLCGRTQHNAAAIVFSEFSNGSQRRLQQFSVWMVSKESIRKLIASSGMIDSRCSQLSHLRVAAEAAIDVSEI